MTMTVTTAVRSRRERLRQQTTDEIRDMAREHLVKRGPQGISLRAVARDVGLSAPALYRYFPSLDDLMTDLIVTCIDELTGHLQAARDASDPDQVPARLAAVSRAFRAWAVRHPAEFSLVFGSPVPGYNAPADGPTEAAGRRFGAVFAGLFAELWAREPFPVQTPDELGPRLLTSMSGHHQIVNEALPPGAVTVFLQCYTRLYGIITMEVFGHLSWALDDVEPLFERELDGLCQLVHTTYTPPQGPGTAAALPAPR